MAVTRRSLLLHVGAAMSLGDAQFRAPNGSRPGRVSPPLDPGALLRLHRSENAYGPSPQTVVALQRAAQGAQWYPDEQTDRLRSRIAALHRVTLDQVVLGCGSSEILRMAVDAFVGPRRQLVVARPTFEWISECARRSGAEIAAVPLSADYSHDLDVMLARAHATSGLVYICNPNNPTGTLTRRRDVEAFVDKLPRSAYVLIDEAHHHYAGESSDYTSFIDRPVNDARVIVSRSFSTVYGLAGLRVGYALCAPDTARLLRSTQLADGVNVAAAEAAIAALEDSEHVRTCVQRNSDDRQEFLNQANARMLRVIDSQTNFVMVNTGLPAAQVVTHFKNNDVLIAGPVSDFEKHIRVSLGTSLEMRRFWSVWDRMPGGHMMASQPAMLHD